MKPYSVYFFDFFFKLLYFIISFTSLFILFFNNIHLYFLFEILPFMSIFYYKRFIITHITHLFNSIWTFAFFYSWVFIFPLCSHQIFLFFKPGWYYYQKFIYKFFSTWIYCWFVVFFVCFHFIIVPILLNFFLYWELTDHYSLLRIESEIDFFYYILWIIIFKCSFSTILSYFILCMMQTFFFLRIIKIYIYLKNYLNLLIFIIITFLYLLIPPDFLLQLFLVVFIYTIIKFFYFLICLTLYNSFQKYQCQQ